MFLEPINDQNVRNSIFFSWFTETKLGSEQWPVAVNQQGLWTLDLRKFGNIGKISNRWKQSPVPSLPSRNKVLVIVVKNYTKIDTKVSSPCPILLNFLTLFHKFYLWLTRGLQSILQKNSNSLEFVQLHIISLNNRFDSRAQITDKDTLCANNFGNKVWILIPIKPVLFWSLQNTLKD